MRKHLTQKKACSIVGKSLEGERAMNECETGSKIAAIYIGTLETDPEGLHLGTKTIRDLVEEQNALYSEEVDYMPVKLITINEESFSLARISKMDWATEKRFRDGSVALCILDGRCFDKRAIEVFTVRAHHFPPVKNYARFCIVEPRAAIHGEEKVDNDQEALKILERDIFRCKLIEPSPEAFEDFVASLNMFAEISSDIIDKVCVTDR